MKKVLILLISMIGIIFSVSALSGFYFDAKKLTFSENSKSSLITNQFDKDYQLTKTISTADSKLEEQIKKLTKKVTYLLLGDFNNENESSENYYKRHHDYLDLRYNPTVPKDENTFSGLNETSQEYQDDLVSGYAIPNLFNQINELGVIYHSYGDIRVTINDNFIISSILLPNVSMKEENEDNPKEYKKITTNLVLYYYFKQLDGEYKLYYLFGETMDNINGYFSEVESKETKGMKAISTSYDSNLSTIYDFSQLNNMTESQITEIYNSNIQNVVYLSSYFNNKIIANANGFFIADGIVVTSWNFLEKSLKGSQYITLSDYQGTVYQIDGILTVNSETDIAVIKLKEKSGYSVNLGDSNDLKIENPAFVISSKSGIGMIIQKGIIISKEDYIQTSIPLSETDEGSPLFDSNGNVIGMNTAKSTNTSISISVGSNVLKEIKEKVSNTNFDDLKIITFEKLKENYYYTKYNSDTVQNNISKSKWKKYSKIGNIETSINLKLIKANYKDGIVSLRYKNDISDFVSSMQLATNFKNNLLEEGYKEVLNSEQKSVFENKKYQIIIMDEFDYLIIVMVRL